MAETTRQVEFFVPGTPVPKGSTKYVGKNKKTGKAVVVQQNEADIKVWSESIKWLCKAKCKGEPATGPISLEVHFLMPRPKAHFGTGRNSNVKKQNAPYWHTSKPDLDKLVRCVKDALTGEIWKDDSQCVMVMATKVYGDDTGCRIKIDYL